jgi:dCTP deaminase
MEPVNALAAKCGGVLSSRQIQAMADAGQIRLAAPLAHGQI